MLHPSEQNWPLGVIQRQLHFVRAEGLAGQCYFRSRFLTDNVKGIYDYLQPNFYAFPALPPACTWLDSIPPTTPKSPSPDPSPVREGSPTTFKSNLSPLPNRGGGGVGAALLTWQTSTDDLPGGVRYNVYASKQWPVDTSNPQNLVAVLLPEPRFTYNPLYVAFTGLHFAVTAIDRCGNESEPLQFTTTPPYSPQTPTRTLYRGPRGQLIFDTPANDQKKCLGW
jgi:hypothetical protein